MDNNKNSQTQVSPKTSSDVHEIDQKILEEAIRLKNQLLGLRNNITPMDIPSIELLLSTINNESRSHEESVREIAKTYSKLVNFVFAEKSIKKMINLDIDRVLAIKELLWKKAAFNLATLPSKDKKGKDKKNKDRILFKLNLEIREKVDGLKSDPHQSGESKGNTNIVDTLTLNQSLADSANPLASLPLSVPPYSLKEYDKMSELLNQSEAKASDKEKALRMKEEIVQYIDIATSLDSLVSRVDNNIWEWIYNILPIIAKTKDFSPPQIEPLLHIYNSVHNTLITSTFLKNDKKPCSLWAIELYSLKKAQAQLKENASRLIGDRKSNNSEQFLFQRIREQSTQLLSKIPFPNDTAIRHEIWGLIDPSEIQTRNLSSSNINSQRKDLIVRVDSPVEPFEEVDPIVTKQEEEDAVNRVIFMNALQPGGFFQYDRNKGAYMLKDSNFSDRVRFKDALHRFLSYIRVQSNSKLIDRQQMSCLHTLYVLPELIECNKTLETVTQALQGYILENGEDRLGISEEESQSLKNLQNIHKACQTYRAELLECSHMRLGSCLGAYETAQSTFAEAMDINRDNSDLYSNLEGLFFKAKDQAQTIAFSRGAAIADECRNLLKKRIAHNDALMQDLNTSSQDSMLKSPFVNPVSETYETVHNSLDSRILLERFKINGPERLAQAFAFGFNQNRRDKEPRSRVNPDIAHRGFSVRYFGNLICQNENIDNLQKERWFQEAASFLGISPKELCLVILKTFPQEKAKRHSNSKDAPHSPPHRSAQALFQTQFEALARELRAMKPHSNQTYSSALLRTWDSKIQAFLKEAERQSWELRGVSIDGQLASLVYDNSVLDTLNGMLFRREALLKNAGVMDINDPALAFRSQAGRLTTYNLKGVKFEKRTHKESRNTHEDYVFSKKPEIQRTAPDFHSAWKDYLDYFWINIRTRAWNAVFALNSEVVKRKGVVSSQHDSSSQISSNTERKRSVSHLLFRERSDPRTILQGSLSNRFWGLFLKNMDLVKTDDQRDLEAKKAVREATVFQVLRDIQERGLLKFQDDRKLVAPSILTRLPDCSQNSVENLVSRDRSSTTSSFSNGDGAQLLTNSEAIEDQAQRPNTARKLFS